MDSESIYLHAAVEHFDMGRFARAATLAAQGLGHFPESGGLWEILGTARWGEGREEESVRALETAMLLKPLGFLARVALAESYLERDDPEAARVELEFLAGREECPVPLLTKVASGLGQLGEYRLALGVCERIVGVRPGHHAAWFGIAYYSLQLGAPPEAVVGSLGAAYQLSPGCLTYRLNLARLYAMAGYGRRGAELLDDLDPDSIASPATAAWIATNYELIGDAQAQARWAEHAHRLRRDGCPHEPPTLLDPPARGEPI
jgi:tetratricopeptide (TPR) repeat protein